MPQGLYDCPICPVDCTTVDMPEVAFATCAENIALNESEIAEILIVEADATGDAPAAAPTDWSLAADWATVLDDSAADSIRRLIVIGDLADAEKQEVDLPKRQKKTLKRNFALNASIMDMSETNYEALRAMQCGGTYFIWYITVGGQMYGGDTGIKCNADPDMPLGRGEESFEVGNIAFTWEAKCHPPRQVSPI